MQPSDLIADRLRPQILWRKEQLFQEKFKPFIEGKHILEIAPNHCLFTEKMLELGAKNISLVENNEKVFQLIESYFKNISEIKSYNKDIHFLLSELPKEFDTVICAGFLYHSPHPLWILEGIANLNPQYILIDTACSQTSQITVTPEINNEPGYRQVEDKSSGVALRLPPEMYFSIMSKLGYKAIAQVNQASPSSVANLTEEQQSILLGWNKTFSYWFERI